MTGPSDSKGIAIFACSGPSSVGQLTNQAAVELTREGLGQMHGLAGVGAQLKEFVQSARETSQAMVVFDGCSMGCAKALLEHVQVPVENHLVATELGIARSDDLTFSSESVCTLKEAYKAMLARLQAGVPGAPPKCLCAEEW